MADPRTALVAADGGARLAVDVAGARSTSSSPGSGTAPGAGSPRSRTSVRDHRVITLDNRGAARSVKPDGPCSIDLPTRDAATALDTLGARAAAVAGTAMGGCIAATLAVRRPDLVGSPVLVPPQ